MKNALLARSDQHVNVCFAFLETYPALEANISKAGHGLSLNMHNTPQELPPPSLPLHLRPEMANLQPLQHGPEVSQYRLH